MEIKEMAWRAQTGNGRTRPGNHKVESMGTFPGFTVEASRVPRWVLPSGRRSLETSSQLREVKRQGRPEGRTRSLRGQRVP